MSINLKHTKTNPFESRNTTEKIQEVKLKYKIKRIFLILISLRIKPLP